MSIITSIDNRKGTNEVRSHYESYYRYIAYTCIDVGHSLRGGGETVNGAGISGLKLSGVAEVHRAEERGSAACGNEETKHKQPSADIFCR